MPYSKEQAAGMAATVVARELGEEHRASTEGAAVVFTAVMPDHRPRRFRLVVQSVEEVSR